MLTVLRRLFSFSDWQTSHPGQPPPGDMLDASFDAQNSKLAELESLLDSVRRSDGRLQNGIVSKDSLDPVFFADLSAKIAQIGEFLLESARLERQNAENAANVAIFAKNTAEEAKQRVLAAESAAEPFHSTLQTGLQTLSEQVEIARTAASQAVAALDVVEEMESHAGYSEAWADSSQAWAEHMPDTIPDNYLHDTDISGDHWSSRWWANKAAHSFGMLVEFYLGAHEDPPTTGLDGGPIDPGSIYYDTDDGRAYVWNGSAWVPLWTPAQTNTLSLWYVATAAQTAFPTATPDINGNSFVLDNANPEGVEVHVNGLLREPDLSGPGGDYTVNAGTSTVTFLAGLTAGDRVCIDVMMSPADMRPGAMNAWALTVTPPPDGTLTVFIIDVIDGAGPATATVGKAEELLVSVDGVVQCPGSDYQASGATLTFSTPPAADSVVFCTWFQALGGSPTGDMTPAEILAALKTVDGPASGIDADLLDGQHAAFFAPIASPTFTGDPKAPTPATADNDTSIATTAFVVAKLAAAGVGGAPAWADITGKPATFPPTTPIPQGDITGLTADLAGKVANTGDTMTGPLSIPPGSATATGLNFGTAGTGLHGDSAAVRLATGGTNRVTFANTTITTAVPLRSASGAVGGPGYSWSSDTDTGFYLSAAGDMRLAMAGADVVKWLDDKSTTFSGKVITPGSTTAAAGFNIGIHVAPPTTPVEGDIWQAGGMLVVRGPSSNYTMVNTGNTQTITAAKTFSGAITFSGVSPVLPTPTAGDNSTKGATTAYVDTADALLAPKASPTFTGQILTPGGSAAAPAIGLGAADLGIYGTAALNFAVGGAQKISVGSTGTTITSTSYKLSVAASTATRAGLGVPVGAKPTTPSEGDIWSTTAGGFYGFIGGVAKNLSIHVGTTAPASPITNDLWLDTT